MLARGEDVVLVIDVQGARQVRSRGIETIGIFVLPPSAAVLEQRLRGRSKDSDEQIRRRLEVARARWTSTRSTSTSSSTTSWRRRSGGLQSIVAAERARVKRMRPDAEAIIGTFHS